MDQEPPLVKLKNFETNFVAPCASCTVSYLRFLLSMRIIKVMNLKDPSIASLEFRYFPVGTAMRAYVMDMYVVRKLHTYVIGHGKVMV